MRYYKIIETFSVKAKNEDEALEKHNNGESQAENVEVKEND